MLASSIRAFLVVVALLCGSLGFAQQNPPAGDNEPADGTKEERPLAPEAERRKQLAELARTFDKDRNLDPILRFETIRQIGELKLKEGSKFLLQHLPSEDATQELLYETYVEALSMAPTEEVVRYVFTTGLEKLSESGLARLQFWFGKIEDTRAVKWLLEKGWQSLPSHAPKAREALFAVLLATGDPRLGRMANAFLGAPELPIPMHIEFIRILARFQERSAADKIADAFRINDPKVRVEVLLALEKLESKKHSKVFKDALKDPFPEVRAVAIQVMEGTHQSELVGYLIPLLNDNDVSVQVAAVRSLKHLGTKDVLDPLIGAMEKAEGRLLDDIADALVWLTGQNFGIDALGWKSWWSDHKDKATIRLIDPAEYARIMEEEAGRSTAVYHGLRILSKNVIFVVDVSASMEEPYLVDEETAGEGGRRGGSTGVGPNGSREGGTQRVQRRKIEVARRELVGALGSLPVGTQFNIIKFSSFFEPWQRAVVVMNEQLRAEAIALAQTLGGGGMTNIFDTLEEALRDPEVDTIYFLTDGAPTAGKHLDTKRILEEISKLNAGRNVKINTIGFKLDPLATELLQKIAEQNYGRFVSK